MAGTYTTQYQGQIKPNAENFGTEDVVVAYGRAAFSTTDTAVNVAVPVGSVYSALLTPIGLTAGALPVAGDLLNHDNTVDGDGLTVSRAAGTTSAMAFNYLVIGNPST
jgi:hypothetical protein